MSSSRCCGGTGSPTSQARFAVAIRSSAFCRYLLTMHEEHAFRIMFLGILARKRGLQLRWHRALKSGVHGVRRKRTRRRQRSSALGRCLPRLGKACGENTCLTHSDAAFGPNDAKASRIHMTLGSKRQCPHATVRQLYSKPQTAGRHDRHDRHARYSCSPLWCSERVKVGCSTIVQTVTYCCTPTEAL